MICCAILALLASVAAIPAAIFGRSRTAKRADHCAHETPAAMEVPGD
jgi:hypothetical protein